MYNVQKQGIYFLLVGLFKKTKKPKQNKIYSKINIDKGYLPSSIYGLYYDTVRAVCVVNIVICIICDVDIKMCTWCCVTIIMCTKCNTFCINVILCI
jgi:hypothetical protein